MLYIRKWYRLRLCTFRHVVLPKDMQKLVPKTHLMSEQEWRAIGVQQSQGWVHYMIHYPGKQNIFDYDKSLYLCQ